MQPENGLTWSCWATCFCGIRLERRVGENQREINRLGAFAESELNVGLGIALIAYCQRSRASCVDGAQSGFECCSRDFDIRPSMEKPSAGMYVALLSLVFQDRDIQSEAWRHVQILRENVQQPQGQLVLCKNPERWQYHAPLQGGASRSSRKSCSKPSDGFLP